MIINAVAATTAHRARRFNGLRGNPVPIPHCRVRVLIPRERESRLSSPLLREGPAERPERRQRRELSRMSQRLASASRAASAAH